jgi:hypothetical protein
LLQKKLLQTIAFKNGEINPSNFVVTESDHKKWTSLTFQEKWIEPCGVLLKIDQRGGGVMIKWLRILMSEGFSWRNDRDWKNRIQWAVQLFTKSTAI